MGEPRRLAVEVLEGCEPEIGRALWAIQDTRQRTLDALKDHPDNGIDAPAPVGANTVGTILYHVALVEASWLYEDVLETDLPADLLPSFPVDSVDEQGILSAMQGHSLGSYLSRLDAVRARLIEAYKAMSLTEYRRVRTITGRYDVTPEWVLHHLMQHEGEHRGHVHVIVEGLK